MDPIITPVISTTLVICVVVGALLVALIVPSITIIGETEVGLVTKRFSFRDLKDDNPIAFNKEAGYQADLLMAGWNFKLWILYSVEKHPWVQIPADEVGIVIAQVGAPLPIGAKSAVYKEEFGNFSDLNTFVKQGGQKGVQRPVLSPGTLIPIHPVAFLVLTRKKIYGVPVDIDIRSQGGLRLEDFGLRPDNLKVVHIEPKKSTDREVEDVIGIVTTLEGAPLESGHIASRIGGFNDIIEAEKQNEGDDCDTANIIEMIIGTKNEEHNNYQDFQAFLDKGGRIGLQHDPLLYGAFALNPLLVRVEIVPMLVVEQGQAAVVKSYVGLATQDTSGESFKFGSLVRPGHRGIWQESLRTGKYPINPRCYKAIIVPTSILTLNWATAVSAAHDLDSNLEQIVAKSREGFVFKLDMQVQIHVPDTKAPRVISMVGTMANLVNEVLQAAVGNHFRDKLQSLPAVQFIEQRQQVQVEAFEHIEQKLQAFEVETRGVYIQDVILPDEIVTVLTQREIASQEIETFKKQKEAQDQRVNMEKSKGTADKQAELASSEVGITIKKNNANARKHEADGEATYLSKTGEAKAAEVKAVGLAKAESYEKQVLALGRKETALVNAITVLAEKGIKLMPEILVAGSGGNNSLDGLAASVMAYLKKLNIDNEK